MNNFATTVRQELINKGIPEDIITMAEFQDAESVTLSFSNNYVEIVNWKLNQVGELDVPKIIDEIVYSEDGTTLYGLYRNGSMVLVGNDMYEKVFIEAATDIVRKMWD